MTGVTSVAGLPEGLEARPARFEDAPAVTAMLRRSEEAHQGIADVELEDLEADWRRPSFYPGRDAVLVLEADRPVGFAEVFLPNRRAEVAVDPDATGRGIGLALLRWTEARLRTVGADGIGQTVSDGDQGVADLLRREGYEPGWTSWILEIALDTPVPDPGLPEGIELGALEVGDERAERAVHALIRDAFSEWPDHHEESFEDWRAEVLERPSMRPGDALLALEDGEPVGAAVCFRYDDAIWVQQLATRRTHRHRGIARGLLRAAFAMGRRDGYATAGLSTDSRTGALGLYEKVGMRVARSYTHYRKRLVPG